MTLPSLFGSITASSQDHTPFTMGRQSKRHELTVENDEAEKLIKVDDT